MSDAKLELMTPGSGKLQREREKKDPIVTLGPFNQSEKLAIHQLLRSFTDEQILVSGYEAAGWSAVSKDANAAVRRQPGAARAENLLTHMEASLARARSKATGARSRLIEGIFSNVSPSRRSVIEKAGLLSAHQILEEKLESGKVMNDLHKRAIEQMLKLLELRLGIIAEKK